MNYTNLGRLLHKKRLCRTCTHYCVEVSKNDLLIMKNYASLAYVRLYFATPLGVNVTLKKAASAAAVKEARRQRDHNTFIVGVAKRGSNIPPLPLP